MEEGRYEEVVDLLRPEVKANPSDLELATAYGAALLRNGQASLAVWPLRRAYRDGPEGSAAGGLLVEALIAGGAVREGIQLADELLEANPDDLRLLTMRSNGHAANLDRESALADIERLVEAAPDNPSALQSKLKLLTDLDRLDEAEATIAELKALLESQELPPQSMARFCGAEGTFIHKHREREAAAEHFAACLEKYPGEFDVVAPALLFYQEIGEHDRGLEMLFEQAATPAGQKRLRIQGQLAEVLLAEGRTDEAVAVLVDFADRFEVPQAWLELADLYASADRMPEAAAALEKAMEIATGIAPGETGFIYMSLTDETRFAYADILIQVGNADRVREILRHIEEPVYRLLIEARLKLSEGDPQGALDSYEAAFRLWPSNPGARYLAGTAALQVAQFELASEMFQNSMRADPEATDAGLVLARMKYLSDQPRGVMEAAGFYSRTNPGDLVSKRMVLLSAAAVGAPDVAEAVRDLMIQTGHAGNSAADYATFLSIFSGAESALEYLDGVEGLETPELSPALSTWVRFMVNQGQGDAGLKRVLKAAKNRPESAALQVAKGLALQSEANDDLAAEEALRRAVELDSQLPLARVALGQWLSAQGETEAAVAEFDAAAEVDPTDPDYGLFAGLALFEAGRRDEAETRLELQLEAHPWQGEAAARLARILIDRGESGPRVLALARLGVEYAKGSRQFALETLARVRIAREEFGLAQAALGRAKKYGAESPTSLYLTAQVLARKNKFGEALRLLEESLETNEFSDKEAAAVLRARLEARLDSREADGS
jgi:tetratricopeptide (TPR) repeat protein